MKGVIFVVLESVIRDAYGEDTWDAILEEAGSDGVYTTLGNYPDEEFVALVEAAEPHLGVTGDEALTFMGRHALAHLADQYPSIFERHASTRTFVLQLNDIIHPEVEKLYPGSDLPTFEYEDPETDPLVLGYTPSAGCARSPRASSSAPRTGTGRRSRSSNRSACARATTAANCA